jgi:O-antigen/teichoic acid export membrane protein
MRNAAPAENPLGAASGRAAAVPASLSGQAGVIIVGRALAFFFAFGVPVVLVRIVSKESYGIYREALFVYSTAVPILQFGLTQSLFYFFPRWVGERAALVTQTLALLAASGLVFAVALVLARGWVADYFGQPAMADHMFWVAPFTALMVVSSTIEVLTIVEQNVKLTFWVIIGSEGLRSLLVVVAGLLTRDVGMMLAALTIFSFARTLFVYVHCRAEGLWRWRGMSLGLLKEQLAYSVPFGLAGTVVTILSSVDRFYVSRFFDSEAFAVYSVGCFQLPIVTVVFTSATSVLLGRMAELQKGGRLAEMLALWRSATRKMSLVSIPVTVVFAVLAREFIVGLFTAEYAEATPIFIAFLLLIPRQAVPYGAVTRAFGLTRFILYACLVALGVAVGLAYFFVRIVPLGLLGPAIAVVAGTWVVAEAQIAKTRELLQVPYARLFPWGDLARMTGLALGLGLVLAIAHARVTAPPIIVLAVGSTLYMAVYYAFAIRLGLIRRDELAEAWAMLKRAGGRR